MSAISENNDEQPSNVACKGNENYERDVIYWQKSLESLSQKVIVGDIIQQVHTDQDANQNGYNAADGAESDDKDEEARAIDIEDLSDREAGDGAETAQIDDEDEIIANAEALVYDTNEHDTNLFRLSCECNDCINYRETIIQLYVEDFEYNTLWERLQLLIKKFYDLIPE